MSAALPIEIAPEKVDEWIKAFKYYRHPPDQNSIVDWIGRFDADDQATAAKVLDHVRVVGERDILAGYKAALESLQGWHPNPSKRIGRWYFVGFGKPGESGPAMLRLFREANNLAYQRFDPLFRSISELPGLELKTKDNVVFVDDFSGTGRQVVKMWPRIEELIASEATCYLVLTALTESARLEIEDNTELKILSQYDLDESYQLFHPNNTAFSVSEKETVERYGAIADPENPKGVGGLGVLFVLSHKSANNCVPILHINKNHWRGLLPRYLKP